MTDFYFRRVGTNVPTRRQGLTDFGNDSPSFSIDIASVTANAGFGTLPPRAYIDKLLLRENGNHAVAVGIGTTLGATNVLDTAYGPLTANGTLTVDVTAFTMGSFPAIAVQPLFLTFVGAAGYSVNASLIWKRGP
jgi:hypothetical protein